MLRMTKLTDYGVVLLTHFASLSDRDPQNARELASGTGLPLPTVGKLLKVLTHQGLLVSHRGIRGGYSLARAPEEISVADVIAALEGPIAITECNEPDPGICSRESDCAVRANWQLVNRTIRRALEGVSLAQMAKPFAPLWKLTPPPSPRPARAAAAREMSTLK